MGFFSTTAVKPTGSVLDFQAQSLQGEPVDLAQYRGKVLLIVNTASMCGFTPQYAGLQNLWQQYGEQGLVILGFPSDNFRNQEYADPQQVQQFCDARFQITFPLFQPVDVKGPQAHPLWRFLGDKRQNGHANAKPRWNFQKYLVDRQGRLVHHYLPFVSPTSSRITRKIEQLLHAS